MNLRDAIIGSSSLNEYSVLYAKRVDGQFLPTSEAVLFALTEDGRQSCRMSSLAETAPDLVTALKCSYLMSYSKT